MPFVLHQFALVRDGYVVAFTDDPKASLKQEPKPAPKPPELDDLQLAQMRPMEVDPELEAATAIEAAPEPAAEPEPLPDLVLLPIVADPDPPLAADERLWGPEYEVLADRVRAYGKPIKVQATVENIATVLQQLGMNETQLAKLLAAAAAL